MVLGVALPLAALALVGVRPAHLRGDWSHERETTYSTTTSSENHQRNVRNVAYFSLPSVRMRGVIHLLALLPCPFSQLRRGVPDLEDFPSSAGTDAGTASGGASVLIVNPRPVHRPIRQDDTDGITREQVSALQGRLCGFIEDYKGCFSWYTHLH